MNKFIVCLQNDVKEKLLSNGFKLISEKQNGNGKMWTFENSDKLMFDGGLNFAKNEIMFTNKLMF